MASPGALPESIRVDPARAGVLISAVARQPSGPKSREFDEFFYPLLAWYSMKRAPALARRAIRPAGSSGIFVRGVSSGDEDAIAHDTATLALARARNRAHLFRPNVDDPVNWILSHAPFAHIDAVRAAYGRGSLRLIPVETARLEALADARAVQPTTDVVLLLQKAMSKLTDLERKAIILYERDGYTYDEIGEMLYEALNCGKKVDHLLQNARYKLKLFLAEPRA
jgi:DNA-directed RNA polymerase specialized sigma24 family protein